MATAANGNAAPDAGALTRAYELGSQLRAPVDMADGGKAIFTPPEWAMHKIPPLEAPLTHVKQVVTLFEMDAFVDYVNRFKTPATRIFAAPGHLHAGHAVVQAVLDYHADAATPGRNAHRAIFSPPYSEEWSRWAQLDQKQMRQADFAEMVEEHRRDIREPDGASLLELVRRFKASKVQSYDSVSYQNDGSMAINWQDKTSGAPGVIPVPEQLVLGIPVFFKGTVYRLDVFMRYRLSEGTLIFHIKRDRPDYIEDAAFTEITSNIAAKTEITVYLGKP